MNFITSPGDRAQLLGIAHRQRLLQDAVGHTEDRRIHPNAQGQ
jgi:hypothetical protein